MDPATHIKNGKVLHNLEPKCCTVLRRDKIARFQDRREGGNQGSYQGARGLEGPRRK